MLNCTSLLHKSFVSTSFNIIHRQLSPLDGYLIIQKYNELNHCDRAQININSDKNI
jgi:hypothetical protein